MNLTDAEIGGAVVLQTIRTDDGTGQMVARMRGYKMSVEELMRMPIANRSAMISKKIIEVFQRAPAKSADAERIVVSAGFGRFDVIEGRKLNSASLTKEEAHALAGKSKAAGKAKGKGKSH